MYLYYIDVTTSGVIIISFNNISNNNIKMFSYQSQIWSDNFREERFNFHIQHTKIYLVNC